MDSPVTVSESTFAESGESILSLLNQGNRKFDEAFMEWRYQKRPSGTLVVSVARDHDGRVIGCRTMFPYHFHILGRPETSGFQADLFVDKEQRKSGIGTKLVSHCIDCTLEKGIHTILGMPNEASTRLQEKHQLRKIGVVQGFRRYFDLKERLSKRGASPPIARLVSKAAGLLLNTFSPEDPFGRESEYSLVAENVIDGEFDTLWNDVVGAIDVVGNRDSRYLKWRYLDHPYKTYNVLKLKRADRLVGYIIYQIKEGSRVYVDDILSQPDRVMRDQLLGKSLLHFKKIGVSEVEIGLSEGHPLIAHLRKFRFRACADQWPFLVYSTNAHSSVLQDISRWHLTFGDKDI